MNSGRSTTLRIRLDAVAPTLARERRYLAGLDRIRILERLGLPATGLGDKIVAGYGRGA